jgi:hypothetical protein
LLGPIERLPLRAKRTITEWAEPLIARGRLGDLRLRGAFDGAHGAALCVKDEPDRWTVVRTCAVRVTPRRQGWATGSGQ